MHKESFFKSITISCIHFLYFLSKLFIVCWALSYYFFSLLYFLMIISKRNLIVKVNPQKIPVELGFTSNTKSVTDNVTETEVVALKTKVSTVFGIVDSTS